MEEIFDKLVEENEEKIREECLKRGPKPPRPGQPCTREEDILAESERFARALCYNIYDKFGLYPSIRRMDFPTDCRNDIYRAVICEQLLIRNFLHNHYFPSMGLVMVNTGSVIAMCNVMCLATTGKWDYHKRLLRCIALIAEFFLYRNTRMPYPQLYKFHVIWCEVFNRLFSDQFWEEGGWWALSMYADKYIPELYKPFNRALFRMKDPCTDVPGFRIVLDSDDPVTDPERLAFEMRLALECVREWRCRVPEIRIPRRREPKTEHVTDKFLKNLKTKNLLKKYIKSVSDYGPGREPGSSKLVAPIEYEAPPTLSQPSDMDSDNTYSVVLNEGQMIERDERTTIQQVKTTLKMLSMENAVDPVVDAENPAEPVVDMENSANLVVEIENATHPVAYLENEPDIEEPADPVVVPADPVVVPADPIVVPADPIVMPANPIVMPANPIVMPADPVVMPADPVEMLPEDPVVVPADPIVMLANPVVMPEGPVVMPEGPIVVPAADPIVMPADPIVVPAADLVVVPEDPLVWAVDYNERPVDPLVRPADYALRAVHPGAWEIDPDRIPDPVVRRRVIKPPEWVEDPVEDPVGYTPDMGDPFDLYDQELDRMTKERIASLSHPEPELPRSAARRSCRSAARRKPALKPEAFQPPIMKLPVDPTILYEEIRARPDPVKTDSGGKPKNLGSTPDCPVKIPLDSAERPEDPVENPDPSDEELSPSLLGQPVENEDSDSDTVPYSLPDDRDPCPLLDSDRDEHVSDEEEMNPLQINDEEFVFADVPDKSKVPLSTLRPPDLIEDEEARASREAKDLEERLMEVEEEDSEERLLEVEDLEERLLEVEEDSEERLLEIEEELEEWLMEVEEQEDLEERLKEVEDSED